MPRPSDGLVADQRHLVPVVDGRLLTMIGNGMHAVVKTAERFSGRARENLACPTAPARLRVVVALVAVAIARAGPTTGLATRSGQWPRAQLIVLRNARRSEVCSAGEVGALLARISRAVTIGNVMTLNAAFARAPDFRWYSDGSSGSPRLGVQSTDRATLLHYFADRHRHRERVSLVAVSVAPRSSGQIADLLWVVRRTATDLPSRLGFSPGKGAIDCHSGKITVWSFGSPQATPGPSPCRAIPSRSTPVSCTRESA
jgi:hypothetical protein